MLTVIRSQLIQVNSMKINLCNFDRYAFSALIYSFNDLGMCLTIILIVSADLKFFCQ